MGTATCETSADIDLKREGYTAKREAIEDEKFGITVKDPYRWLENPDSAATQAFVVAQQGRWKKYLNSRDSVRTNFYEKLVELFDFQKCGVPFRKGKYYYYWLNSGMQNQYVLYQCKDLITVMQYNDYKKLSAAGPISSAGTTATSNGAEPTAPPPVEFLNPNRWDPSGVTSVTDTAFSEDGTIMAYAVAEKGSDWNTVHFIYTDAERNATNNANHKEAAGGEEEAKRRKIEEGVKGGERPISGIMDVLKHVRFSCLTWTHDNAGLFYNRFDVKDRKNTDGTENDVAEFQKLCFHRLGTPQSEDVLCASFPDNPTWMSGVSVSHEGRFLFLSVFKGCEPVNRVWMCDLRELPPLSPSGSEATAAEVGGGPDDCRLRDISKVMSNWKKLVDDFEWKIEYVANWDGAEKGAEDTSSPKFVLYTNKDTPEYKLVTVDLKDWLAANGDSKKIQFRDLVTPVSADYHVLEYAFCVRKDLLAVHLMRHVKSVLQLRSIKTGELVKEIPLDIGTVGEVCGHRKQTELFYSFYNFLTPGIIYKADLNRLEDVPQLIMETKLNQPSSSPSPYYSRDDFVVKQVFYKSSDGTVDIPMFLVHRKEGVPMDGSTPTVLYGYGGFNISLQASFSVSRLMWLKHFTGIFALANIRGGGEYGKEWHQAAVRSKRQTGFDDFQLAAEFLVKEKYTSPNKLAIQGGSNGGLLVGACLNQRPDLYRAAVAQVPVMDLMRFHKFTAGHAWLTEYGNPDERDDFESIHKISPLHNLRVPSKTSVQFPSLLVTTADHDDRVSPLHALKYMAELQHIMKDETKQTNPLLIRIETAAGHGAGKPTMKVLEETADTYSFIASELGATWREE